MTGTGARVSHILDCDGFRLTAGAQIKENDGSISRHRPNNGRLNLIEANVGDGVRVVWPLYLLRSRAVLQIPDADAASTRRCGEAVARSVE